MKRRLTPEMRTQRVRETRETAAHFLSDMQHIRRTLSAIPESGDEIRRLSAVLRRLLVDGDLPKIAPPRIGKLHLLMPDNNAIYRNADRQYLIFFNSLGVKSEFGAVPEDPESKATFGLVRAYIAIGNERQRVFPVDQDVKSWRHGDPKPPGPYFNDVEAKVDAFLSQKIICFHNRWATRKDVIKFAANIAGGVHSDEAKDETEVLLSRMRGYGTFQLRPTFHFRVEPGAEHQVPGSVVLPFRYAPDRIDPTLMEILASARYLTESPDIVRLEAAVRAELDA